MLRLLAIAILAALLPAADSKPDFTGAWILDSADVTVDIKHNEPEFVLSEVRDGQRSTFRMTIDGKECRNPYRGAEMKSRLHWEGSVLVVNSEFGDTKMKDRMSLSADRKSFTSERAISTAEGERSLTYVFRRAEN